MHHGRKSWNTEKPEPDAFLLCDNSAALSSIVVLEVIKSSGPNWLDIDILEGFPPQVLLVALILAEQSLCVANLVDAKIPMCQINKHLIGQ